MRTLSDDELAAVLKAGVPEPPERSALAARAREQARRIRRRRRGTFAVAVIAVLAIALPTAVNELGSRHSNSATGICPGDSCETVPSRPLKILAAIRKPLHLPAVRPGRSCPVSPTRRFSHVSGFSGAVTAVGPGSSPGGVYLINGSGTVRTRLRQGPWHEAKTIWLVDRAGPVLLRGGRIDAKGPLGFAHYIGAYGYNGGSGDGPHPQLFYVRGTLGATVQGKRETYPSGIYVKSPGCYAIQIDGIGFSEHLVIRVRTAG